MVPVRSCGKVVGHREAHTPPRLLGRRPAECVEQRSNRTRSEQAGPPHNTETTYFPGSYVRTAQVSQSADCISSLPNASATAQIILPASARARYRHYCGYLVRQTLNARIVEASKSIPRVKRIVVVMGVPSSSFFMGACRSRQLNVCSPRSAYRKYLGPKGARRNSKRSRHCSLKTTASCALEGFAPQRHGRRLDGCQVLRRGLVNDLANLGAQRHHDAVCRLRGGDRSGQACPQMSRRVALITHPLMTAGTSSKRAPKIPRPCAVNSVVRILFRGDPPPPPWMGPHEAGGYLCGRARGEEPCLVFWAQVVTQPRGLATRNPVRERKRRGKAADRHQKRLEVGVDIPRLPRFGRSCTLPAASGGQSSSRRP